MKYPKNRGNLYLVERRTYGNPATVIVGGFSSYDAAADYKDACLQEWVDKDLPGRAVRFKVVMTTYYDG